MAAGLAYVLVVIVLLPVLGDLYGSRSDDVRYVM